MNELLSIFFFLSIIFALSHIVIRLRNIPFAGALPIALSCFIGLESILLNMLSLFQAVNRFWLFVCHAVLLMGWFIWAVFIRWDYTIRIVKRSKHILFCFWKNPVYRMLLPVLIILLITAVIYPPNNTDSMIYHMARVAHWIQNSSIDYYPTPISHQNVMGPGAEYIILFFQLLTGQDVLANIVQFFSLCILIVSTGYISRTIGIPKKYSSLMVVLTASAPMALLQATTTKNDLVATVMVFAIITSCFRFILGNRKKVLLSDYLFIGVSIAGGYLVKPTSLLVAAPFVVAALIIQVVRRDLDRKKIVTGTTIAFLILTVIAGPDIYRKISHNVSRHEVYPLTKEWSADRLWNPLKTTAHHFPFPDEFKTFMKKIGYKGILYTNDVFNHHEDLIGNPFQNLLFLLFTLLTILLIPFIINKSNHVTSLMISLFPALAWLFFSLMVRDQLWMSRLQLPLFFLTPVSMLFIIRIIAEKKMLSQTIFFAIAIVTVCSLAYGTLAMIRNQLRPIYVSYFWGERPGRSSAYYNNGGNRESNDFLLKTASNIQCNRVGLIASPNSYDYPLTWRAMKRGIEVRHLRNFENISDRTVYRFLKSESNWPCLLYAAPGVPEHVPNRGTQWLNAGGDGLTFVRNLKYEFENSDKIYLLLKKPDDSMKILPLNQVFLSKNKHGIVINALGNDPSTLLPEFSSTPHGSFVVKIEIDSPRDTISQIFYTTKRQSIFSEEMSKKRPVFGGLNKLYFQLPGEEISGPLRFDPGKKIGKYLLHSIEARSIS